MSGSYYPGDIFLFRGLGKGQYAAGEKLHLTGGKLAHAGLASAVSLADWNRDGKMDLIVGNIAGEVWFLPNESHDHQLLFGAKRRVVAAGGEVEVDGDAGPLVADWDGDGIPDLLVGASDGSVTWFRGSGATGAPKLGAGVTLVSALPENRNEAIRCEKDAKTGLVVLPQLDRPSIRPKLAVVDWNGDGKLDLIVGDAMTTLGPEPVLTDEQKKERAALEKQHQAIGNEISRRFSDAENRAREELSGSGSNDDDDDLQSRIQDKASEALSKDDHYHQLHVQADELWKKLRPLKADNSMHGFVWVYLRTKDAKTADAESGRLQPAVATATTEGTLVVRLVAKETGNPVRNLSVEVQPKKLEDGFSWKDTRKSKGTIHESLRPDEQGVVEFTVPAGQEFEVMARDSREFEGRANSDVLAFSAGERRELKLEISTQADLEYYGRLVGSTDGAPIPGARIRVIKASSSFVSSGDEDGHEVWSSRTLEETISNSDGSFHLAILSWKHPYLRIDAEGCSTRIVVPAPGHEDQDKAEAVKLTHGASLRASVLDASGNALGGISVVLTVPGYELRDPEDRGLGHSSYIDVPEERWKAESGPDGRCVLSGLLPDTELSLELRRNNDVLRREPRAYRFKPGEGRDVEWKIGSGSTLKGQALDQDGKPVVDRKILLQAENPSPYFQAYADDEVTASTITDKDGRFEFKDVSRGTWQVGPAPLRESWKEPLEDDVASLAQVVEVAGETTQDLVLHVYRGLYVRGSVVGPDGSKLSEGSVHAQSEKSEWLMSCQLQKDGSFAIGPLGPEKITLTAQTFEQFAPSDPVRVEVGQRDVLLRVRAGGKLRGTVVDAVSGAACGAELSVMPDHPGSDPFGGGMGFSSETKENGAFEHGGLEPGSYGLSACTNDGRFGVLPAVLVAPNATADGLVIRVSPGGTLHLRYQGALPAIYVTVTSQGVAVGFPEIVQSGSSLDVRAPAGSIALQIRKEFRGEARLKKIDLAAGETKDVVLRDDD